MIYRITEQVLFDVADKSLNDGEKKITLSGPACRILMVLLENNNRLVSREDLLRKVWDDFGLEPSENSLNTNMSMLRKSFSELNCHNLIETLPKIGFLIKVPALKFEEKTPTLLVADNFPASLSAEKRSIPIWQSMTLVLLMILGMCIYLFYKMTNESVSDYYLYERIDKCQIYYVKGIDRHNLDDFFAGEWASNIINNCDVPAAIYYDEVASYKIKSTFNTIVSKCNFNNNGIIDECKNYISDGIH